MAYLSVFFLFFNEIVSLKEVLLLEAVYYVAVVFIEVPSGYFSDVIGRKKTLIISSILFIASYLLFGVSTNFIMLAVAQVLLAAAIAFRSGTDTSFYYESLSLAGREEEYPQGEANVQSWSQLSSALAVLLGGLLGAISLNLAYYVSALFVVPALFICFRFIEPDGGLRASKDFIQQIILCLGYLKNKKLLWLFLFSVLMYAMTHIPYEFYQPYLKLLEERGDLLLMSAPIASGILFAGTRVFAAYAAKMSVTWAQRFGFYKLLLIALVIQLIIIGGLSITLHVSLVLLVLFRNFSMLLTTAPINAEIAPMINQNQRATYFSIQSLAYRLSFASILLLLSVPLGGQEVADWAALSWILRVSFIVSFLFIVWLYLVKPKGNT